MNIQRENGIDEVNCAFRMLNMSLEQSYDNGGFRLPSYIMYLIKEMQEIELDFSFVVC